MADAPPPRAAAELLLNLPLPSDLDYSDFLHAINRLHHMRDNVAARIGPLTGLAGQIMFLRQELARISTLPPGELPPAPHHGDGLPEEAVARFLKTAVCQKAVTADGEVCAVCLDDLHKGGDRTVMVLGCGHDFHDDCIGKWLLRKNACPLCRAVAED